MMSPSDPFDAIPRPPDAAILALPGPRGGYLQIAPAQNAAFYAELPDALLCAAKDWAIRLEALGARRVYWIVLSEVVRRLHIHLYPRWTEEESRGIALFEERLHDPQPLWTPPTRAALSEWTRQWRAATGPLAADRTGQDDGGASSSPNA